MFHDDRLLEWVWLRLSDVQRLHGPDQVPLRVQQPEEGGSGCLQERRVHPVLHLSGRVHQHLQHRHLHTATNWKRRKVDPSSQIINIKSIIEFGKKCPICTFVKS